SAEDYLRKVRANIGWSLLLFCILWGFFRFSGFGVDLFGISTSSPLIWILVFAGIVPGQYTLHLYYPQIIARGRKNRIDLDLPYAISYMQALSTTMPPFGIIRKVYEEQDMFGTIAQEFGMIVRDVELFGDDLNTAMKNLQHTTPSTNLRDFLNDLSIVFDSGGNVTTYLGAKTEFYRDQAKQELELVLKTIEIMAEVYVTAFVAGPIALIIMIVAQGMTSSTGMAWILPMMYISIPAGAILMIWILSLMLPPENLEVSRKETVEYQFGSGAQGPAERASCEIDPENREFYRRIQKRRRDQPMFARTFLR
ncbi:MAG TPA: type II secretion system F family protein, partial [Methanoregula sp.]|nr:type II secretion system F family protein [Methanoregula sp.]